MNFLQSIFQRRSKERGTNIEAYRACVHLCAERGDLSGKDAERCELAMEALGISPDQFTEDVGAVKQLGALEKVAATAEEARAEHKSKSLIFKELNAALPAKIKALQEETAAARQAWTNAGFKFGAANNAAKQIKEIRTRHQRLFDPTPEPQCTYLAYSIEGASGAANTMYVETFHRDLEDQLAKSGKPIAKAPGQTDEEFQSLLEAARAFAAGGALYLRRRNGLWASLNVPGNGTTLESLIVDQPEGTLSTLLPWPGTRRKDFAAMLAEYHAKVKEKQEIKRPKIERPEPAATW